MQVESRMILRNAILSQPMRYHMAKRQQALRISWNFPKEIEFRCGICGEVTKKRQTAGTNKNAPSDLDEA